MGRKDVDNNRNDDDAHADLQDRQYQANQGPQRCARDANDGEPDAGENSLHDSDTNDAHGDAPHRIFGERHVAIARCRDDAKRQLIREGSGAFVMREEDACNDDGGNELQNGKPGRGN